MTTAEQLIAFERRVFEAYERGEIRAPIHLDGGNEEPLIKIFSKIKPKDFVCGTWRQHYHCLLKGVPEEALFDEILAGHSISLQFPEHRIVSSAIAGGILSIALGLSMACQARCLDEHVWCFVGDMTANMGCFGECVVYAAGHHLPIDFVIEDNGRSVVTPTRDVWKLPDADVDLDTTPVSSYGYAPTYPHSGIGKRVDF